MTNIMVDVEHLDVCFSGFYAVRDVCFSVQAGEIFGFLGANGAGKTTTIRVLCGLLRATSGKIIIDNTQFSDGMENSIKQKVGYMSQKFTLYDDLSVKENFDFAAALREIPSRTYKKTLDKLLNFIDFKYSMKTIVKDLPGGIKQEIALCVALLHDPKIVFLDEPTAGVAPKSRSRFWQLIRELAKNGKTIFVTTHYMDEAENCNRIALMRAGEIIALDSPENLKRKTFKSNMYSFTPHNKDAKFPPQKDTVIFEPYGQHWHIVFKDNINTSEEIKKYSHYFKIVQVQPSLEDVFIKLVEGTNR